MKSIFIKMISIALTISISFGVDKTGTTAAKFLSIDIGARAVGMGGAFTSIANDATAMYNSGGDGPCSPSRHRGTTIHSPRHGHGYPVDFSHRRG